MFYLIFPYQKRYLVSGLKGVHQSKHNLDIIIPKKGYWHTQLKIDNLSPWYGQMILVSGYPVLTAVNWSQHRCAICVQYQSSCAPKLAKKCGIEHWLPCGTDWRAAGGRCTVRWLANFLAWVDLLTHGAPQARFARQRSAIIELTYRQ